MSCNDLPPVDWISEGCLELSDVAVNSSVRLWKIMVRINDVCDCGNISNRAEPSVQSSATGGIG